MMTVCGNQELWSAVRSILTKNFNQKTDLRGNQKVSQKDNANLKKKTITEDSSITAENRPVVLVIMDVTDDQG